MLARQGEGSRQQALRATLSVQERVENDTLLIYHNAAFALLADCTRGTDHVSKGTGKRTHFVQLNALARQVGLLSRDSLVRKFSQTRRRLQGVSPQVVAENPRWHLVDLGHMSESFLAARHLRDAHHPNRDFTLHVMNVYLNLHWQHGYAPRTAQRPARHAIFSPADNVRRWDQQYLEGADKLQSAYLTDAKVTQERCGRQPAHWCRDLHKGRASLTCSHCNRLALERQDRQGKQQELRRKRKERASKVRKRFMNLSFG